MRCTLSVLLLPALLWLPPALAQENEAEKLFRAMEKKIKAADAVLVTADIAFKGKNREGKDKGSLLLTKDHKVRWRLTLDDGNIDGLIVADGKKVRAKPVASPELAKGQPVPKNLHGLLSTLLSRAGVTVTFVVVTQKALVPKQRVQGAKPEEIVPEDFIHVADFKVDTAAKVGDRDAKVIGYNATLAGKDKLRITLWLDAKTGLPLKRVVVVKWEGGIQFTETYTAFRFDPKIEAKAFELTK